MKRKISTVLATAASCIFMTGMASAQAADISNTGPNSNNTVTSNASLYLTCNSTNGAVVSNTNQQESTSGTTNVSGNTSGEGATSGSSSNSNTTNTSVTASNGCGSTATSEQTPLGGQGGGAVLGEATGGQGAGVLVASLPATGELSSAQAAAGTSAALSGLALAAYALRAVVLQKQQAE